MSFLLEKKSEKSLDNTIPIRYSIPMLLTTMTMGETLDALPFSEEDPTSRFWFRSPCYFVRTVDVTVHVILPELLDNIIGASPVRPVATGNVATLGQKLARVVKNRLTSPTACSIL